MGSVPVERAGAASGISETAAELGGALGIAILGTLGATAYRKSVTSALPIDVGERVTIAATNTLGSALKVASELTPPLVQQVADAATEAVITSVQIVSIAGAAAAVIGAVAAVALLGTPGSHDRSSAGTG